jgi:hypothetical protein
LSLLAVLAVSGAVAPRTASAAARLPCSSPGTLIEATRSSVLTRLMLGRIPGYYACTRGHPARHLGFANFGFGGILRPRIAGRYAALAYEDCPKEPGALCPRYVERRDLKTSRRIRTPATGSEEARFGVVAIAPSGSVAWSISTAGVGAEIHRLTAAGDALLAAGPSIDPRSVALSERAILWVDGEAARSAPLA